MIKFEPPVLTRHGSARSVRQVRAAVLHTETRSRRLEVFITKPVLDELGWISGGIVAPHFARTPNALVLRLAPAHSGLRATPASRRSPTVRVVVSGAPLARGLCAKVRVVDFNINGQTLFANLPRDWGSADRSLEVAA